MHCSHVVLTSQMSWRRETALSFSYIPTQLSRRASSAITVNLLARCAHLLLGPVLPCPSADLYQQALSSLTLVQELTPRSLIAGKGVEQAFLYSDESPDKCRNLRWLQTQHDPVLMRGRKHSDAMTDSIRQALGTSGAVP